VVMAIGFASMLTGAYCLRRPSRWVIGIGWGLAGYAVFYAAPSFGLPPELPGTSAAELLARQYWWLGTAFATAIGLGLLFLQSKPLPRLAGGMLLLIPHLLGAPQPAMPESLAPEALQVQFIQVSALSNLLFWLVLGSVSAALAIHFGVGDENQGLASPENWHG